MMCDPRDPGRAAPEPATSPAAPDAALASAKLLLAALFVGCLVAFFVLGGPLRFDLAALNRAAEPLRAYARAHRVTASVAAAALYAAATALNLPVGVVLSLGIGFVLGRWVGTLVVVVGATLGATAAFLAARYLFADAAHRWAGPAARRLIGGFERDALHYLLFLRLVPLFPFWLVNLVPAFTTIPVRTFVLATALGIVPGTFVFVNAGSALAHVRSTADILSPGMLLAFALLGLLALVPVLVRRFRHLPELDPNDAS